jgi:hypothetical protein
VNPIVVATLVPLRIAQKLAPFRDARPRFDLRPRERRSRSAMYRIVAVEAIPLDTFRGEVARHGKHLRDLGSEQNAVKKHATCGRRHARWLIAARLCGWCSGARGTSA